MKIKKCKACNGVGLCVKCGGEGEDNYSRVPNVCSNCNGSGLCPNCNGSGEGV